MDKLAKKLTKFLVVPAATIVMGLTAYAAPGFTVSDYIKEEATVSGLTTGAAAEYSLDKTNWIPLLGTKIDVSGLTGKTIYVREIGKTASADVKSLAIPRRALAPTGVRFTPDSSGAGPQADKINVSGNQEYKIQNLDWQAGASGGIVVGEAEKLGATFSVRTKATAGTFASQTVTVAVPIRAAAPAVKYDEKKDVITVKAGQQYKLGGASAGATGAWTSVAANTDILRSAITAAFDAGKVTENGEDKFYVYVRTKGTSSKSASDAAKIEFPALPESGAPEAELELADEKITGVSTTMEYRLLTAAQFTNYKGGDNSTTYSNPAWVTVSGSEINMTSLFSLSSASADEKTKIQVRYKPVPATATAVAKPASDVQSIAIEKRAVAPTGTTGANFSGTEEIIFDYADFGEEKIAVRSTLQYKIGTTGEWLDGAGETTNLNKVDISAQIPDVGTKLIYLRVKADVANNVPASKEFTHPKLAIAARGKMPAAKFTASTGVISGITSGAMSWTDKTATDANGGTDAGAQLTFATLGNVTTKTITGFYGTVRDIELRTNKVDYAYGSTAPSAMAVPISETQTLTCEFPPAVSQLVGNIELETDVLTGAASSEIGTVDWDAKGYSVIGNIEGADAVTLALGTLPSALTGKVTLETGGVLTVGAAIPGGTYSVPIVATYVDDGIVKGADAVKMTQDVSFTITKPIAATATALTKPVKATDFPGTAVAGPGSDTTYTVESTTWSGGGLTTAGKWTAAEIPVAVVTLKAKAYNTFTGLVISGVTNTAMTGGTATFEAGQGVSADGSTVTFTVTFTAVAP